MESKILQARISREVSLYDMKCMIESFKRYALYSLSSALMYAQTN